MFACCLFLYGFLLGSSMVLRNVCWLSTECMALYQRRENSLLTAYCENPEKYYKKYRLCIILRQVMYGGRTLL
jgi:hypothetical protein